MGYTVVGSGLSVYKWFSSRSGIIRSDHICQPICRPNLLFFFRKHWFILCGVLSLLKNGFWRLSFFDVNRYIHLSMSFHPSLDWWRWAFSVPAHFLTICLTINMEVVSNFMDFFFLFPECYWWGNDPSWSFWCVKSGLLTTYYMDSATHTLFSVQLLLTLFNFPVVCQLCNWEGCSGYESSCWRGGTLVWGFGLSLFPFLLS